MYAEIFIVEVKLVTLYRAIHNSKELKNMIYNLYTILSNNCLANEN